MGAKRVAVWRVLFPDKFDVDGFETLFLEELDSWFSADISCCDFCYDEYAKLWPGLAASEQFQCNGIPLDCFYSGSCFQDIYSESEFLELCREMGCPNCSKPLECNIWPYDPPFDMPENLQAQIRELEKIASRTPFLVLDHPLAKKILNELIGVESATDPEKLTDTYYRARGIAVSQETAEFMPPPASVCREGRYNHAGRPVLYLANSHETAFQELGTPVDGVLIADVQLTEPLKVLDLSNDELPSDLLLAVTASSLLSAPTTGNGWDNPEYAFSRFIADCVIHVGFNAIKYPSVAKAIGGANLAVLSPPRSWKDLMAFGDLTEFIPSLDTR